MDAQTRAQLEVRSRDVVKFVETMFPDLTLLSWQRKMLEQMGFNENDMAHGNSAQPSRLTNEGRTILEKELSGAEHDHAHAMHKRDVLISNLVVNEERRKKLEAFMAQLKADLLV